MKKLFTLGLSLVLALSSQAKDEVRKLWDFTGQSEKPVAILALVFSTMHTIWTV